MCFDWVCIFLPIVTYDADLYYYNGYEDEHDDDCYTDEDDVDKNTNDQDDRGYFWL